MRPRFRMVLWMAGTGIASPACSSGGIDNSGGGAAGGAIGGLPSGGEATGGTLLCEPGLTRLCVGPGACSGGQKCDSDGTWTDCDCGQGGSPGTGGVANPSGGATNPFGGWPNPSGGVATGGTPTVWSGGVPNNPSGGVATGGTPVVTSGGTANPIGGRANASGGLSYPSGGAANPSGGVATGGTSVVTSGGMPGSSGATATGGAVAVGGAPTGGGPNAGGSLDVTAGGYVQSSTYQGYAWTAAGPATASTITPANFDTVTTATQLCVSGSVEARSDYGGYAMLGINLNQSTDAGTGSELPYSPAGSNVTVNVTNTGGSVLRLQIQAPGGDTDANLRWCADLTGSGGTIALSSFNTQCWQGGAGAAYAGQPLQFIVILVPGGNATAVAFNFCLNALSI